MFTAAETSTILPFPAAALPATPSYFVVMIDYGRVCEAVVNPEMTRRDVVACLVSREYDNVRFIHEVSGGRVTDVTLELQLEASMIAEAA